MKVVYMGTPEYAVYPLDKLLLGGHDIVGVYTQPDRQTGRGQQMKPSAVKVVAQSKGLDVFQPKSLKGEGVVAVLEKLKPDIIVVAAYGLILPVRPTLTLMSKRRVIACSDGNLEAIAHLGSLPTAPSWR